jgi:hypothetical protein
MPKENWVEVEVRDARGRLLARSRTKNLIVNSGLDFINTQVLSTTPGTAGANYIALSTDTTAPAATDTSLLSEQTTNGLARAQGTLSHTAGTNSSSLAHTWTYTGATSTTIAKVGLFNAASAGTMVAETLLSSTATVSANGDQITVTWTITL